jgi:hypothetical protein
VWLDEVQELILNGIFEFLDIVQLSQHIEMKIQLKEILDQATL